MAIDTIPIFIGIDADAAAKGAVNAGSARTFAAVTAHIDQMAVAAASGGGVIRKAHLEVGGVTNSGTAITGWSATLAINGGAASAAYAKTGQAIGGPGTYYPFRVDFDFTAWLAANWPSATASCSIVASMTLTGTSTAPVTINATAILWVTVEYTPASCPTLTKWAPLLLGNFDAGIGTSYVQIAAIPQLTGLASGTFRIPEAGATMRQAVLEIVGDSGGLQSSASLGVPSVRINGATVYAHTSETTTGAGNSRFERFLVDAPSPAASGTVELKGSAVNASYPFLWSGIQTIGHYVYSYTVSGTTEVLVAAYHAVGRGQGLAGYGTESDAMQFRTEVQVPEASVVAQGPMGWRVNVGDSDHFAWNMRGYQLAGPSDGATVLATKTSQRYERVRHSDSGDNAEWAHRVDAGAGAGGAHTLAAGFNYFKLNCWASTIAAEVGGETYRRGIQPSAVFHYAYNAPVAAAGPHAHTHVVEHSILPMSYFSTPSGAARFNASSLATATERDAPPVPATAYYQGTWIRMFQVQNTTAIAIQMAARQSGFPFVPVYEGHPYGGYAVVWSRTWIDLTAQYLRYPAQPVVPGGGWTPSVDLDLQMCCGNSGRFAITQGFAYHEITRTITVTVTGYSGDGSGIAVKVFRADTGERVADLTTGAGGTASFAWPDAVAQLYASAAQGGTAGSSLPTTSSGITVEFAGANKGLGSRFNPGFN